MCRIFLGLDVGDTVFYKPGAYHHARWMSKTNYALKMYIFRKQFELSKYEMDSLYKICIFIVFVYVKYWVSVPSSIAAPNEDCKFIKYLGTNEHPINVQLDH